MELLQIPLFPLNTVLYPGLPMRLHIFEPRYRQMVAECLQTASPFGVVLIREGQEAGETETTPHEVGCAAAIAQHEPLSGGRSNITIIGETRFRIVQLVRSKPYLMGLVEPLKLALPDPEGFRQDGQALRPWVVEYLRLLAESGNLEIDLEAMPRDPERLVYFGAALLQTPLAEKQSFLEENDGEALVGRLLRTYRKELALLRAMLGNERSSFNTLSLN